MRGGGGKSGAELKKAYHSLPVAFPRHPLRLTWGHLVPEVGGYG